MPGENHISESRLKANKKYLSKFADFKVRVLPEERDAIQAHGVPEEKIISRYHKALANIPAFIGLCDICHIYDNTVEPFRIFRKHKETEAIFPSEFWSVEAILQLTGRQGSI